MPKHKNTNKKSDVARRTGAEARTERNKKARMARHAKRYPKTSTKTAVQRRAMGRAWKAVAADRAAAAAKPTIVQVSS